MYHLLPGDDDPYPERGFLRQQYRDAVGIRSGGDPAILVETVDEQHQPFAPGLAPLTCPGLPAGHPPPTTAATTGSGRLEQLLREWLIGYGSANTRAAYAGDLGRRAGAHHEHDLAERAATFGRLLPDGGR
jgi:hypothetical protein